MKRCPACHARFGPSACFDCRELNVPDLSDAHVDRVARHLFRAFDDVNIGREPLHDFDVMVECARGDHWYALAREAIRLGAVVPVEGIP